MPSTTHASNVLASPPMTVDVEASKDSPIRRLPSFKWAQYVKPAKSPTKPDIVESPQPSPQQPNLKSFKVSLDDPTWRVLPAALKKYRINSDNWQNYAMFICYGSTGNLSSFASSDLISETVQYRR